MVPTKVRVKEGKLCKRCVAGRGTTWSSGETLEPDRGAGPGQWKEWVAQCVLCLQKVTDLISDTSSETFSRGG